MDGLEDIQKQIDAICREYPTLGANGILPARDIKTGLLNEVEPIDPTEFRVAAQWLVMYDGFKRRKTVNTYMSSYGWKHVVERNAHTYITNGAFVCAALALGYKMQRIKNSPNVFFNISKWDSNQE